MDKHLQHAAQTIIANLTPDQITAFSGSTVLLTGSNGFLGSQFVHTFLSLNDQGLLDKPLHLTAMDNALRGAPPWLTPLMDRDDLTFVEHNIVEPIAWENWHYVIHAASIASPIFYRKHPIETMDANVTGLRHILDACVKNNHVKSVLFFSSSEIYGDPDPHNIPTTEDYRGLVSCTGPRACYDESKRYGETLCVNFHQVHGVPVKIARPFNNYGPGLKITDRRVLPDFFRDILNGKDIVLLSDGSATRTFCYITDAITGYLQLLLSDHNGQAFNIGNPSPEISMLDLAKAVINVTGNTVGLQSQVSDDKDYLTDNPLRRCPNIDKAKRLLGYTPTVSLEEGLSLTYQYYQTHSMDKDL